MATLSADAQVPRREVKRKAARPPGRPSFQPTDVQRRQAITLAAHGNRPEVIAAVLEISEPTLRKYFWPELQRGRLLGEAKNSQRLHAQAEKGNVTAMIWLDKTRFGVREPGDEPKKLERARLAQTAQDGTEWEALLE